MKVIKTVKEKKYTYDLVVPETEEEAEDIKRIIREVEEEDKLPFDPSKWTLINNKQNKSLMPKINYFITLDNQTRITCYFETINGKVQRFVIKLEILIDNQWTEIERYDTHHKCIHKDILDKTGNKKRSIEYDFLDNKSGPNVAIKDFRQNYQIYTWRYLND